MPDGIKRVIIENVQPSIDDGRFPIRRAVGETVQVRADIFSDGHDQVAAELVYRKAGADEWRQLLLGIDRLDYTKGIPERFLAFERALEKYPDLRRQASLIQVVVPSRTMVPDYQNLKELLDQLAGRINARFGEHGWIPIHYQYRSLERTQLLAHYRTCEIALISPLRDGMNLVAKEYCAATAHRA